MAKTVGPLLSLNAHGSLSKTLTYSHRKSGPQVRKYNKPTVEPSAKQKACRRLNQFATIQWLCMSAATKASWEAQAKASALNLAGYHYFLHQALQDPYTYMDLIGYWPLNQIINNKVLDFSGRALHGDLKPSPPSDAPILAEGWFKKFGSVLSFDGSNDYLDFGTSYLLSPAAAFTLEIWNYPISNGVNETYFENGSSPVANTGFFFARTSGDWYHLTVGNGIDIATVDAGPFYKDKLYCHVATFTPPWVRIYANGAFVSQATLEGTVSYTPSSFFIGQCSWAGGHKLKGLAGQACFYKRALSAEEILMRYNYARQ